MTYQEHPRTPSLERLHAAKWASVVELSVSASLVEHQDKHLEASRQPLKSDISRMPGRAIFQHSVWHYMVTNVTIYMSPPPSAHLVGRKLHQSCPNLVAKMQTI